MKNNALMQKTLETLRKQGYYAERVERWNAFIKCRQDMLGFIDILALDTFEGVIVGVQVCADSGWSAHRKKILSEPRSRHWLRASGRILLWSWKKKGRFRIEARKEWLTLDSR